MGAKLLKSVAVPRPWGRSSLPVGFRAFESGEPIGEIWHCPAHGEDAPLLVKHLFTAGRLSIQVHPDDAAARQRGLPRGKDEAWLILDAEDGACIGLGLERPVTRDDLAAAAATGEIERLVDWRAVRTGDFIYSPAGTVHAIGAGLSLVEIQQNVDVTYRLYDYGRGRELHLDKGIGVASPGPWSPTPPPREVEEGRSLLAEGGRFVVEKWQVGEPALLCTRGVPVQVVHLGGAGMIEGIESAPGSVWAVDDEAVLEGRPDWEAIVAYPGPEFIQGLRRPHPR